MTVQNCKTVKGQGETWQLSNFSGPAGSVVEHPLRDWEVVGSNPGRAIPKALKMVPVATLLGAQYYKASTVSLLRTHIAQLTTQRLQKNKQVRKKSDNNQCL